MPSTPSTDKSDPAAGTPGERVAYFPSWSIYANSYYVKTLDTNGTAAKLTKLNYAFENIDAVNLTCFAANKPASTDENSTTGNDGSSDAWADYQKSFTADQSVDGVADTWGNSLKGNFNQLKKLKAKYPNLRTLVTIGGWTFSKYFSDVAATDASRKKFVSSCIDLYIKGNLPKIGDDPSGGSGAAAACSTVSISIGSSPAARTGTRATTTAHRTRRISPRCSPSSAANSTPWAAATCSPPRYRPARRRFEHRDIERCPVPRPRPHHDL